MPILSLLAVVLLSLSAVLPEDFATELAAVVLIVTSQVWNMTFSFYSAHGRHSPRTGVRSPPSTALSLAELQNLELPCGYGVAVKHHDELVRCAGFFSWPPKCFALGHAIFRLAGLGSYLQIAANEGNLTAVLSKIGALMLVIVLLDQVVWRPLAA